jgi:hypothetical protein
MLDVKLPKEGGLCLKVVEERDPNPNLEIVLNVVKDTKRDVLRKLWVVKDVEKVDF